MRKKIQKSRHSSQGLPSSAWRLAVANGIHLSLANQYGGRETPNYGLHYAALVATLSEQVVGTHYEIVSGTMLLDLSGSSHQRANWHQFEPLGKPYVWVQRQHQHGLEIVDLGTRHWRYWLRAAEVEWAREELIPQVLWEWQEMVPRWAQYRPDPEKTEHIRSELYDQRHNIMPFVQPLLKDLRKTNPWRFR